MNTNDSHNPVADQDASAPREHVTPDTEPPPPLRDSAEIAIAYFLQQLEGECQTGLHDMVLSQVEEPLLQAIMDHTAGNQSRAAHLLGLNRGTLRKKLRRYGLLAATDA